MQAAILSLKLPRIDGWIERRRGLPRATIRACRQRADAAAENAHSRHTYYVYVVEHPADRDGVLERLAKRDINCNVSYRWPIHIMRGSADLGYQEGQFPVAERKAQRIFSLPMYPHLRTRRSTGDSIFEGSDLMAERVHLDWFRERIAASLRSSPRIRRRFWPGRGAAQLDPVQGGRI